MQSWTRAFRVLKSSPTKPNFSLRICNYSRMNQSKGRGSDPNLQQSSSSNPGSEPHRIQDDHTDRTQERRTLESNSSTNTKDVKPLLLDDNNSRPIDIGPIKSKAPGLKPSLFQINRGKRREKELPVNDSRPSLLRPGMILLKNYIAHDHQIEIVKKCRQLGLGTGGFYQPGYNDGAKLHLHMMCLGKDWDPQTRKYEESRSIDGAIPPIIPTEFVKLVTDSIQESHDMMQKERETSPEKAIPRMEPDICIVNFYAKNGKLGLHQDRDESSESLRNGLPVVSISIGDSAEFLFGDERDVDKAEKVELKSGDVLIFGGESRHIYHGVSCIIPDSAPKFLAEVLRPGRLNLTFRKY